MSNQACARVRIDAPLAARGWNTPDAHAVRHEVVLPNGTHANHLLCDRHDRSLAVIEPNPYPVSPGEAAALHTARAPTPGRAQERAPGARTAHRPP